MAVGKAPQALVYRTVESLLTLRNISCLLGILDFPDVLPGNNFTLLNMVFAGRGT